MPHNDTNNQHITPLSPQCQEQKRYNKRKLFFWLIFALALATLVLVKQNSHDQFLDQFIDPAISTMMIFLITMVLRTMYKRMRKRRNKAV
jgi:glucan phosphoethanolaminetransferase (alkaline phosphatase superfamily)